MQTGRTEKIGNVVLDYSHYPEQDFYCDGASEDALLELVKTIPPREYPQRSAAAGSTWGQPRQTTRRASPPQALSSR